MTTQRGDELHDMIARGTYISLERLRVAMLIGAYAHEHQQPQTILIDARIELHPHLLLREQDDLKGLCDYSVLRRLILEQVEACSGCKTLEYLGCRILQAVRTMQGLRGMVLEIRKPDIFPDTTPCLRWDVQW